MSSEDKYELPGQVSSFAEFNRYMLDFIEGKTSRTFFYHGPLNEETAIILPQLLRLNREYQLVTTGSQPASHFTVKSAKKRKKGKPPVYFEHIQRSYVSFVCQDTATTRHLIQQLTQHPDLFISWSTARARADPEHFNNQDDTWIPVTRSRPKSTKGQGSWTDETWQPPTNELEFEGIGFRVRGTFLQDCLEVRIAHKVWGEGQVCNILLSILESMEDYAGTSPRDFQ